MFDIRHQFEVNAPIQSVFDTFCIPEGLNAWWTLEAKGKPIAGEIYHLYFGLEYDWRAQVIHVKHGSELTWQMTQSMDDWMPTKVGFVLQEEEGKTIVRFFHIGWQARDDHFAITNFCWGQLLQGLKNYLEKGEVVAFAERN